MALDYANERYVRIYVRDTVTVKLLSWHARALLWELLRKADRAGVIDVGQDGNAGIAALVSAPTEVVDQAMPELLARGVIRGGDGCFVFPNFIAAQETPQSDKLRKQKSRELKRDTALNGVTVRDVESQNVTKGHAESHDVTLSLAEPNQPSPKERELRDSAALALAHSAVEEINRLTGRSYDKHTAATHKLAQALTKAKHTEAEVLAVIRDKHAEWGSDAKMADRICPGTLLAARNFARYLDELNARGGQPRDPAPPPRAPFGPAPIDYAAIGTPGTRAL